MLRTAKCSSSVRLVHAFLWYFVMNPYKQSGPCQDNNQTAYTDAWQNTTKLHVQILLGMDTWLLETCQRQYNWIKLLMKKVWISLVLTTYVYHNARLEKCKFCYRVRLLQLFTWDPCSSGTLCVAIRCLESDVTRQRGYLTVKGRDLQWMWRFRPLKKRPSRYLLTSISNYPMTPHHIPGKGRRRPPNALHFTNTLP